MGCRTNIYFFNNVKRYYKFRRRYLFYLSLTKGESCRMIKVLNLTKRFGKKTVIEDVNLKIHPRKITSFIGPNGAGKSTLLSMVSRLINADTGEVFLDKTDISTIKSNDFIVEISVLSKNTSPVSAFIR